MQTASEHDPAGERLMQIGEVADRVQLSHRTVRYYDDEGLLTPTRSAGNFRLYTEADVQRLLLIRQMKPLGFSLEDMGNLIATLDRLDGDPDDVEARAQLGEFIDAAQERREKLARQVATADVWIRELRSRG